jgi:anti-sigma factor RsiW
LLVDPSSEDAELRSHLHECPACGRFAAELAAFEPRLHEAMRLPVPERLRERMLFAGSMAPRRRWRRLAAAAVLLLGVMIGYGGWQYAAPYRMADDMIAHMAQDPLHRMPSAPDAGAELAGMGAGLGVECDAALLAQAVQTRLCDVQGKRSAHFVIEHEGVRVTAFVLPEGTWPRTVDLEKSGLHGRVIQTRHGVIALFAEEKRMLAEVAGMMRGAIDWRSA